jgi:hypothetical protein
LDGKALKVKHYKDPQGNVYAYEADGSQDGLIPESYTLLTDQELASLRAPTAGQLRERQIALVKAALGRIDLDKIRPLTDALLSNDTTRLAALEAQAVELRAQLAALTAAS